MKEKLYYIFTHFSVSWNMCVTVSGTINLSGTFFWVITHTLSSPRTPILVTAPLLIALNAYSFFSEKREEQIDR